VQTRYEATANLMSQQGKLIVAPAVSHFTHHVLYSASAACIAGLQRRFYLELTHSISLINLTPTRCVLGRHGNRMKATSQR